MTARGLTREQVERITPQQVHEVLGRTMLVDGFPLVVDLRRSHGMYLRDARWGRSYLDFFGYFATSALGHNHPKMMAPEFLEKMGFIATQKPSNSDLYTVEMAQFVATFERVAMPAEMRHLFFIAGGALAVENALKVAFDWKVGKNLAAGKGERGFKVMHFYSAFHGRSGYTLSLTNTFDPNKTARFAKFNWPIIEAPRITFPLENGNLEAVLWAEERAVAEMEEFFARVEDDIAAIIIEPIQGEGGDNHFRPEFLQELRRLADAHDALLIFDEVQTGLGLTGKMWAYQHFGAQPDVLAFGKKTQVCGIMAGPRVDEVAGNVFQVPSRINSTWGGNLVDMVRARRILEVIEEENLVENAAKVGDYLRESLLELQAEFPWLVSNARGRGLMCAIDLPDHATRKRVIGAAFERGLIVLSCGEKSIRFRPALICQPLHVDLATAMLAQILRTLKR